MARPPARQTPIPDALHRNVSRYLAFSAVSLTPFCLPVIVLFWRQNGLDMVQVYVLQAIFAVAIVLLEVPTGMVADVMGKRLSLLLAMGTHVVAWLVYAASDGFAGFLAAELLIALGLSLHSGAGSALLYDTLKALGREDEFERLAGRARSLQMVSFAVASLLGGWLGDHSIRATVWLSALGPAAAFLIAWSLHEARPPTTATSARPALDTYRDLIRDSWRFVRRHALVRWQILFLAVLTGSSAWLLWLYQPYMEYSGLPVWAFGIAFTIFNLASALASHKAHAVDRRCGRTGTILLLAALQIAPLFILASVRAPLAFLWILGHQAVRGLSTPIFSARILRSTYADKRATVLSIASMAGRLFLAITAPAIGWVTDRTDLPTALHVQGAALVLILGVLLVAYRRIPPKYFQVKREVAARQ